MPTTSGANSSASTLPMKKSRKRMSAAEQYVSNMFIVVHIPQIQYNLGKIAVYKVNVKDL